MLLRGKYLSCEPPVRFRRRADFSDTQSPNVYLTVPDRGLHEGKYDGYRLIVQRDGDRVRLITRGGYN